VAIAGEILGANLSVMGTHGMRGMQRLMGSNALKMVAMSSTPYLLLVKEQQLEKVDTIVMPFSFVEDTLFVLDALVEFAKQYESVIHLVGYYDKVEWQNQQSLENQQTARKFLEKRGLACEIVNLPRDKSYEEELSDYMYKVNADLIAASYFKNSIVPPPNSFIQVMLDNDHLLPMLTVNGDAFKVKV
jgi:nucleotide-binding universal stress UspA family protein